MVAFVAAHGPVDAVERLLNRTAPRAVLVGLRDGVSLDDARHDLHRAPIIGARLLIPEDPRWPRDAFVTGITRAPFALWVRGDGDLRERTRDAVTFTAAHFARPNRAHLASSYAADLAAHGITVVTPAGFGSDGQALRSAVDAAGERSLYISAGGLNAGVLSNTERLIGRVLERGGLIVSAAPLDADHTFRDVQHRNLLAAALGSRLLVLSAPNRHVRHMEVAERPARLGHPVFAVAASAVDASITHLIDHGHAAAVGSPAELRNRLDALGQGHNHTES